MGAVSDDRIVGMDLTPVGAAKPNDATVSRQKVPRVKILQKSSAGLLRSFQQQVVERAAIADKSDVLGLETTRSCIPGVTSRSALIA